MDFEWDKDKARSNVTKHGVSFEEATTIFGDSNAVTFDDPRHSIDELRFLTIGTSETGRALIVSHTARGSVLRIISARSASRAERKGYEDGYYPRN